MKNLDKLKFNKVFSLIMACVLILSMTFNYGYALEPSVDDNGSNNTEVRAAALEDGIYKEEGGTFYYKNGAKVGGWVDFEGEKYYFNTKTYEMMTGFQEIDGGTYFFCKTTGRMKKGFVKIGKNRYYFGKKSGKMYRGLVKIRKNVHTFNEDGILLRSVYGNKKAVCLTYDDGPAPGTLRILKTLRDNKGLATFFVVGNRVAAFKDTILKVAKSGCQIGNHSYSHSWFANLDSNGIKNEVDKCDKLINQYANVNAEVVRTPGGQINDNIKVSVGKPIILWSIDTVDWRTRNANSTYNSVMNNVKDGSIVLMHDLHLPTADASERIIPELVKKGYQLVTINEMKLLKGYKLKAGGVYFSF